MNNLSANCFVSDTNSTALSETIFMVHAWYRAQQAYSRNHED